MKDVNDNKPKFEQKLYTFRIKENEKVGHFIGSVIANDSDIDKATNGRITYSFVDGGSPFNINPTSGNDLATNYHVYQTPVDRITLRCLL